MSDPITASEQRLQEYLSRLTAVLGHADRKERLVGYCTGLLLPGERKSVEPMAARLDPAQVPSLHQALHHFVATAAWSDAAVLAAVREQVLPALDPAWPDHRLDHRRHQLSQEGHALGRRGAPILRPVGQAGELPGRRVVVGRQ